MLLRLSKKDRKAWLRMVETVLAIMVIMGAILMILGRQAPTFDITKDVYEKQKDILDIINKNDSLREQVILKNDCGYSICETIKKLMPNGWNFAINICNITQICGNVYFDSLSAADKEASQGKEIFASEVLVASTLKNYDPKKLRLFVWQGEPDSVTCKTCGGVVPDEEEEEFVCDGGQISFVSGYPQGVGGGTISFIASTNLLSGDFKLRVYQPDKTNYLDSNLPYYPVAAANEEEMIVVNFPSFPSLEGSIIALVSGDEKCQDYCTINEAGNCINN